VPFERGTDLEYAPDGKTLYLSWTGVGCYNSEAYSGVSGWRGYNTLPLNRDEIEAIFGGEFPWGGIDFSLDGRWSAVNGYWGIGIWDQINQRYFLKTSNSTIQGEVFSEDGRWVVLRVLGAGAETQIFKLPEGEDFDPEHPPEPALTIERSVYGEEYDFGAENRLAAGTSVWDIETGEHLGTTRLSQFFTHPDADYIVEITPDLQAIIRDLATGAIRMTIQLHQEYLYTMKLFPESVLLPVAEKERILYSARTGQPLTGNLYTWTSPVLNRDRTRLLIPLSAEYIPEQELEAPIQYQVIDTSTGEVVSEFALQAAISTDDGPKDIIGFATSDDELRFWDFQTETFLPFRLPGARDWDITIDPEDRVIVALNYDNQRGYTWDLQTGEMLPRLNDVSDNYLPSLDADSMRLTTFNSFERLVHVYDLRTGKEIASREFPNTQYLGILTISGEVVHIQNTCWERFDWNFVTDELITEVDVPVQRAAGAYDLLSPNSALGLIYDNDQVTLWDVAEDRPVTLLNTSGERVGGLEFTADGRFLIGRNAAQQVMVWGVPAAE
jgi:WD40 repeat protein